MHYFLALASVFCATTLAQGTGPSCPAVTFLKRSSYASYVALGDSYAAGLGSYRRLRQCGANEPLSSPNCTITTDSATSNACDKDQGSYAYQFATAHVAPGGFAFPACSGDNTTNLQQRQLRYLDPAPELVTVQVGGDDRVADGTIGTFTNVLTNCLGANLNCTAAVANATQELETILGNVDRTLEAINAMVPATTAKALVGYLQFFGHAPNCTIELLPGLFNSTPSLDSRLRVNELVVTANKRLIQLAASRGFLFINADPLYERHRWCDVSSSWWLISTYQVSGVDTANQNYTEVAVGHPTIDGQKAYLTALTRALGL